MRVNYFGSLYCTHATLPHLKQSKGLIVVVSSLAGKTGVPTRTGYAASKHALHGFFDSLRIELLGAGVDVTIICPDFVTSEIRKRAFRGDGKPLGISPVKETEVMPTTNAPARSSGDVAPTREFIMSRRGKSASGQAARPGMIDKLRLSDSRRKIGSRVVNPLTAPGGTSPQEVDQPGRVHQRRDERADTTAGSIFRRCAASE
jgi:NAD(P)-dependent dehydrogenase (short-subunit alcohol dehydrogenase family)